MYKIVFEMDFDGHLKWFESHWYYSFYLSIVYIVCVFCGQKLMENRKPFELRKPLAAWNAFLAVFSILGTVQCLPEFIGIISSKGIIESFCSIAYQSDRGVIFWHILFCWSKLIELGDTLFIILRKQRLIRLHWIHHIVTLICCFSGLSQLTGAQRWTVMMNFSVHSLMYTYYTFRSLRYKIPSIVSKCLTLIQMIQMIIGLIMLSVIAKLNTTQIKCTYNTFMMSLGAATYAVFLVLFLNFYIKSYFSSNKTIKTDSKRNKID